jgi:hypothetical protein
MKILITGDRNYRNIEVIEKELNKFPSDTVLIHGTARGADSLAASVAKKLGMKVLPFEPKWHIYGRGAGPIRNQQMLDEGKPDLIIAFHDDIKNSLGTKDMINKGIKARKKVILIENGIGRELKSYI